MVEISPAIRIKGPLQRGSVFYFAEEQLTSEKPHYFVVLNKNPKAEEFLVLAVASSKVEKRRRIAKLLKFPEKTLVIVQAEEYSLFTTETVIDCNSVIEKTVDSLIEKLKNKKLIVCSELMPESILNKLTEGVIASSQVRAGVQNLLAS